MSEELLVNKDFIDGVCSVCGHKLTKYGTKTLKDGVLCRTCVAICSPWYTDDVFLNKTVEDIREHIDYRKNNHNLLETFNKSVVIEGKYSLFIDEDNRNFMFSKRKDIGKENPDILSLDEIEEIRIVEEDYLDENGVDLLFEMDLNNDEINSLSFRVNEFPGIGALTDEYNKACDLAYEYMNALLDENINLKEVKEEVDE